MCMGRTQRNGLGEDLKQDLLPGRRLCRDHGQVTDTRKASYMLTHPPHSKQAQLPTREQPGGVTAHGPRVRWHPGRRHDRSTSSPGPAACPTCGHAYDLFDHDTSRLLDWVERLHQDLHHLKAAREEDLP